MKRRYVRARYIFFGIFIFIASLILFTRLLLPFEKVILRIAGSVLLRYDQVATREQRQDTSDRNGMRVLSHRADEFQNTLLVVGNASVGQKATVGNVLIGNAIASDGQITKIELVSSPGHSINVVFTRSGIPASLQGKGAGILETKMPRGSDIVMGDEVYNDEGVRLVVGHVGQIIDISSDPFVTVRILSPINSTTLTTIDQFL